MHKNSWNQLLLSLSWVSLLAISGCANVGEKTGGGSSGIGNSGKPSGTLSRLGVFETGVKAGSEIVAYDKASSRVFTTNGAENKIDILDISDVTNPILVSQIDLSPYGTGVNSVAARGGKVAVAVEVTSAVVIEGAHLPGHSNGEVVIFDTDGAMEQRVVVGYLPDMVTFNEDGTRVIVANEGEPVGDYSFDPEGTIGIVNLTDGSYTEVGFASATLTDAADGTPVRLGDTPSENQAQDLEPEYIAVNGDYAWVTLQENNAMARINLQTNNLDYVKSFGAKSWEPESGNTVDIEEEGEIRMKSYTGLFGLYMPDSIAAYEVNGATYLVTANEGDGREYPATDIPGYLGQGEVLTDEEKISRLTLDDSIAAEYADENDLKVVIDMGDSDNDGDFDKLFSFGTRSFSIWDANGDLVFDSGDEISRKVKENEPELFNQSNGEMDGRSGNKGAEPEALAVGTVDGKTWAFVGLERQNAIVVYDITTPADAKFVEYFQTGVDDDISPEGMKFVAAPDSPNGKSLLLVSFEISGSTVIYQVKR